MFSEQYQNTRFSNSLKTATIWVTDSQISIENYRVSKGFVWTNTTFVSFCLTPNEFIGSLYEKMDDLEDILRDMEGNLIVARDFNAHALE